MELGQYSFYQDSWTIEGWIRPTTTGSVVSVRSANNTAINLEVLTDGRLVYRVRNPPSSSGGFAGFSTGAVDLLDGNWHHFAATKEDDDTFNMYIDGVDQNLSNTTLSDFGASVFDIDLGRLVPTVTRPYGGEMDEIRFWDFAQCLDQITAQSGCELTGTEIGLVAYYDFNQGFIAANNASEINLNDRTANNHNAVSYTHLRAPRPY